MKAARNRRQFLKTTAVGGALAPWTWSVLAPHRSEQSTSLLRDRADGQRGPIRKTLKQGMIQVEGDLIQKFRTAQEAGFDGVEMDSPGMDVEQTRNAIATVGIPVDGTVCSTHWQIRHTDPDPAQRKTALEHLQTAIRDTHAVGGHTVLLVVGHGNDGPEAEIWPRAIDNISQAIPLAAERGVYIAIENVWNHFLYDHGGGADQTAEKYVRFVDELNSPWVGMQFDIGNHWKYGSPAEWIRQLGRRIVKLDIKGFSRAKDEFTPIGAGDIDWPGVCAALREIGFTGWAAAEVAGGDLTALRDVAEQMNRVLELD
jgi:hexulose-6-phosphate isomerase